MSKSLKWVLIIGAVLAVTFTGLIGIAVYNVYTALNSVANREVPAELKNPRVLVGADFLTKTEFFKLNPKSYVEIISEGAREKEEKARQRVISSQVAGSIYGFDDLKFIRGSLVAAARYGAFEFGVDGKLKSRILFEPLEEDVKIGPFTSKNYRLALNDLKIVPLSRESYGFVSGSSMDGMTVYDAKGNILWNYGRKKVDLSELTIGDEERDRRYEESVLLLEAAVGDLDNDGTSEFIAAMKKQGIKVFSRDGKELWSVPEEFPSAPLLVEDLDGDGTNELIQIGRKIIAGNGKSITEIKGDSSAAVVVRNNKGGMKSLQSCDITHEGQTLCVNETGETILNAAAPLSEVRLLERNATPIDVGNGVSIPPDETATLAFPRAVWVKLRADEPEYLAIVGEFIGLPRSNLYVYDSKGNLVFHELLPENARTIAVLHSDRESDSVVVGGVTTIWKYDVK